jgi:hypothetical protein
MKPRVIVNEGDPIAEPREGAIGDFMNIGVDKLQRARSMPGAAWEWVCAHISSKAWLTNQIRCGFDVQSHASDEIALNQRFHISEVVMSEFAMPE